MVDFSIAGHIIYSIAIVILYASVYKTAGNVIVKCAEQGKGLVKIDLISENFESLKKNDLRKGASGMADYRERWPGTHTCVWLL